MLFFQWTKFILILSIDHLKVSILVWSPPAAVLCCPHWIVLSVVSALAAVHSSRWSRRFPMSRYHCLHQLLQSWATATASRDWYVHGHCSLLSLSLFSLLSPSSPIFPTIAAPFLDAVHRAVLSTLPPLDISLTPPFSSAILLLTDEGGFQLMQLICSTFKMSCPTFNWVVWFSSQPYLASQSS